MKMAEKNRKKEKHQRILEYFEKRRDLLIDQIGQLDPIREDDDSMGAYNIHMLKHDLFETKNHIGMIRLIIAD